MYSVESAVIAAAGMGTRLGAGLPKCLVRVAGRPIIDYQLALLREVPHVFIVVGFREMDVIEYVRKLRPDVIFVRNADFQHTKTLESFYLAARGIEGRAIFMDGDMILEQKAFHNFIEETSSRESLIAVTRRLSDEPVYAEIKEGPEQLQVVNFSYEKSSDYEWANVACLPAKLVRGGATHFFEFLRKLLPLPAAVLDRLEVDTYEDLHNAEELVIREAAWSQCFAEDGC